MSIQNLLITKRELKSYTSTWMGYVITAIGLLFCGLLFNSYAIGDEPKLSSEVLYDYFYFTSGIVVIMCIFLSMRLIAEEKQNGTLVLYFTSPISERSLIYGKFRSVMMLTFFILLFTIYMPLLIKVNGTVSWGHLLAGYMCLFLLGGCASAATLFASSIAPNQLIAVILGAFIIGFLFVVWQVAQIVDQPFNELFSYIAIHNTHFYRMSNGLVHVKDIVFYVSVIFFFLECAIRSLQSRRWRG